MTAAVAIQNAYAPGLCVGEAEMGGGLSLTPWLKVNLPFYYNCLCCADKIPVKAK